MAQNRILQLLNDNRGRREGLRVQAQAGASEVTVYLYDAIVTDDWWGGISAQSFVRALAEITADVTGEKAPEGLSRVQKFNIAFSIKGDIDDETRQKIAHLAEDEICTVSNTIRGNPEFSSVVTG